MPRSAALLAGICILRLPIAAEAQSGSGVTVLSDVDYLPANRAEKLDLYLPANRSSSVRSSAVVLIHGGAGIGGDKAESREREIGLVLARAGYVAASVNYLLGDRSWPVCLLDCKNAVRFLRARAAQYQIDPNRIAVLGGSTGARLALMIGFTADRGLFEPSEPYPGVSDRVSAVIDMYGGSDYLKHHPNPADPRQAGIYGRPPDLEIWKEISPITYLTKNAPPVLILQGKIDPEVPYPQSVELAGALEEKKVPHELILLDGVGHSFDLETWKKKPLPRDLRPIVLEFLSKYLAPTPKS